MPGLVQRAPTKLKQMKETGVRDREIRLVEIAAAQFNLLPTQLFDFNVYPDRLVVILPDGSKHTFSREDLALRDEGK